MDRSLKCQLCSKKLKVNPNCPCALGAHLLEQHPDVNLTFFSSLENLSSGKCDSERNNKVLDISKKVISCRKPSSLKVTKETQNGFYKTQVETWKPAKIELVCPRCRKRDNPSMRRQKNKISSGHLGAFCMLSCWPLCVLPFVLRRKGSVELFCKHCGCYLGEYNRATGVLTCICNKWDSKAFISESGSYI